MASTLPLWLMIITVAVYGGFLVGYGETVFDSGMDDCDGLVTCTAAVFAMIGNFWQFVTLGGFDSPLPALVQAILVLFFSVSWGLYIHSMVVDTIGAVVP